MQGSRPASDRAERDAHELTRPVRVGIAQWHARPGAKAENVETALALVDQLGAGCDLVLLPELWSCGYDPVALPEHARACAEPLDGPLLERLRGVARDRRVHLVPGSLPERDGERCFNTTVLIDDRGELVARHRKAHLYGPAEQAAFAAGDALTVCEDTPFGTVGLAICFDGDFPETARALRRAGARLVVSPCAYDHAAERWWDLLFPANALVNGQWWVQSNQAVGPFFGRSRIVSPQGEVVAEARRVDPGAMPAPETLVAELGLSGRDGAAQAGTDVLLAACRPDLPVERHRAASGAEVVPAAH